MPADFLPPTVVDALELAARGERGIRFIERDDDEHFVSYATLRRDALALLRRWRSDGVRPGDEVVLHLAAPREFVPALWACLYGRLIAVPLSAGSSQEHVRKLLNVRAKLQRPWLPPSRRRSNRSVSACSMRRCPMTRPRSRR
jgi:acyl-CoA synthetase (AMP-forming)/AMP-acid ligase II